MTEYQGMIKHYFAALGRFFLFFVVRPVALLFGALVSSIYKVFFAWWLDGLTSRGLWRRLERDIRNDYTWLFQEYKATALPFEPYRQVRNRSVKRLIRIC
jgi:hypothetical protein